ncbi:10078_t:CDS:10 [Funneliformis mosseae]|uniref:10078_t:CDS:1 n=1 Tax=Funneliformis mosseae TaxID=27381 RepID=A0A9N9D5I0_FUNMO|nr:10078_t:CDS:10 [Funneliformis mosseae]
MYEPPDSLKQKLDSYFLSDNSSSLSDWNNWSFLSFLEFAKKRRILSIKNKRDLHQRFSNSLNAILMSDASRKVKEVTKALQSKMCSTSVDLFWKEVQTNEEIAIAQAEYQRKQTFIELKNGFENRVIESREREVKKDVNKALSVLDAPTIPPPGNASTAPPLHYTPTTPPCNASTMPPPLSQNILKRPLDIYETKALGQSVISHFEAKMQEYKPKKALSTEVMRILKTFNVSSLEDLGKALDDVKIDYNNLDRDIIYLRCLFENYKSTINFDNRDLPEGWYNSHIVAPIFDDCLESIDECILRCRQFEFIYVETATTSVLSKSDKDLSKLHNAIILIFKHMVLTLLEKLLHEISSMPILCVQFSGVSVEVYLAIWLANMRPVVFSIIDFEIAEEITTFLKMTKVAAKMLSLRPFIQNLHKRYQTLLTKEADYYLNDDNTWTSPIRMKARH